MAVELQFLLRETLEGDSLEHLHLLVVVQGFGIGLRTAEIDELGPVGRFLLAQLEEFRHGLHKRKSEVDLTLGNTQQIARVSPKLHRHIAPRDDGLAFLEVIKRIPKPFSIVGIFENRFHGKFPL